LGREEEGRVRKTGLRRKPRNAQAIREKKSHIGYLEALLLAEIEERGRNTIERRIKEAHLPRVKTLEEFDYAQSPNVTAAKMRDLADGGLPVARNVGVLLHILGHYLLAVNSQHAPRGGQILFELFLFGGQELLGGSKIDARRKIMRAQQIAYVSREPVFRAHQRLQSR
jgi:hypothetical protein